MSVVAPSDHFGEPFLEAPEPKTSTGRKLGLVGGLVVLVGLVAGGGAYAFSLLGGGGPQPESVMPQATVAFTKVDLDPSAGQKLDALRFALKFPSAKGQVSENSDLGELVFKSLQKDGPLQGIDFAKDVKPWLGKRVGVGIMPGATKTDPPVVMVALAVTDQAAAQKTLDTVAGRVGGARCQMVQDYALCTQSAQLARVVKAVAAGTLADNPNFRADMNRLGETGVASAWVDAGAANALSAGLTGAQSPFRSFLAKNGMPLGSMNGMAASPVDAKATGRSAVALRFDGANLELVGHATGMSQGWAGTVAASTGLSDLPKGTLAAVGVANPDAQLKAAWPQLERGFPQARPGVSLQQTLAPFERATGLKLPDDLYAALGDQFTVAFGGQGTKNDVKIAAVTTGDPRVWRKLSALGGPPAAGGGLVVKQAGAHTVLASSQDYADEVASGSGLGSSAPFQAALPAAAQARFAAYLDIAGVVAAFKDQIPAETASQLAGLSSFGVTVSGQGTDSDFDLRLITK
ncbi:MAG TPA: DUF3352 domain-containing protein [Pedococcus sp.]|nr:DUF3352 domain-containing protein [Pedococcus sp.]